MTSPPTTRLNTRLTKTRIFPTMVMVHPLWVGPPCRARRPQATWRRRFRRSLLPRERAGGDYAACRILCQREFVPPVPPRSLACRALADGLSSQLLDALVETL